jgi:hypothetical protein
MVVGTRIATVYLSTALKAARIATSVLPNPIKPSDPLDDPFHISFDP